MGAKPTVESGSGDRGDNGEGEGDGDGGDDDGMVVMVMVVRAMECGRAGRLRQGLGKVEEEGWG